MRCFWRLLRIILLEAQWMRRSNGRIWGREPSRKRVKRGVSAIGANLRIFRVPESQPKRSICQKARLGSPSAGEDALGGDAQRDNGAVGSCSSECAKSSMFREGLFALVVKINLLCANYL